MYKTSYVQLYTCIYHLHYPSYLTLDQKNIEKGTSPFNSERASWNCCLISTQDTIHIYDSNIATLGPNIFHFFSLFCFFVTSVVSSFNIQQLNYTFFLGQSTSLWQCRDLVYYWALHYQNGARCGMPFLLLELRWLKGGGVPGEILWIPCSSSPEVEPEDLS